jgi:hypothetical protein
MTPTPFEGALGSVHLIAKTRTALQASCDEAWCRQTISKLQFLEAVLYQVKDLSPTTASEDTMGIVELCGLPCAPFLGCFLQDLEKLQPDLDRYLGAGEDRPDVGGPPLWATAVEQNTVTLMNNIGMHLQLIDVLLRVESLRKCTNGGEIQRASKMSSDQLSPATATNVPSQQYIMSGNDNVYQGIEISGNARAHIGESHYHFGTPKASVDKLFEKLTELATARQADALQSSLQGIQKKQSKECDVLSALEARTLLILKRLRRLVDGSRTVQAASKKNLPSSSIPIKRRTKRSDVIANEASSHPTNPNPKQLHDTQLGEPETDHPTSVLETIRKRLNAVIMILLMGSPSVQHLFRSSNTFSQPPSMLHDSNIRLVDALNREISLPYEHFRYWPVVLARLKCEFRGLPGEAHILNNKFGLFRSARKSHKEAMIPFDQWERSVFPGDRLVMSIDVEEFDPNECPSCGSKLKEILLVPVFSQWFVVLMVVVTR